MKPKPLLKNKKGQAQYFLESAFRIGFLIIAMVIFFLLISLYLRNQTDVQTLTHYVVLDRLLYSDAIMYEDNGRVYTGIIDIQKFDDARIEETMDYSVKKYATAKLTLIKSSDGKKVDIAYLNQKQYDQLQVLVDASATGKGGAKKYIKQYPVTYKESNSYIYGTLIIEMIIPNS